MQKYQKSVKHPIAVACFLLFFVVLFLIQCVPVGNFPKKVALLFLVVYLATVMFHTIGYNQVSYL